MAMVLIIAGSDSSGGAGVVRDLATLADHHVDACCAITAVTAQTNNKVFDVHHVPPNLVQQQISTALAAHQVDAIKIGMLGRRDAVAAVITALNAYAHIPLIIDPVLRSSSGGRLLDEAGISLLREQLLTRAFLLTPNIIEAAALLNEAQAHDEAQLIAQGKKLLDLGPRAVLIKGGHAWGDTANDLLLTDDGRITVLTAARVKGEMRGTGCAVAASIAAYLAKRLSLEEACIQAKRYISKKFEEAVRESTS